MLFWKMVGACCKNHVKDESSTRQMMCVCVCVCVFVYYNAC